jgi:hypothetical protein
MFLDHPQRRSTVGRTPLDEWSARRRDLYLTTHDTHNRQISMPSVGFKPKISAGERPAVAHLLRSLPCQLVSLPDTSYRDPWAFIISKNSSDKGPITWRWDNKLKSIRYIREISRLLWVPRKPLKTEVCLLLVTNVLTTGIHECFNISQNFYLQLDVTVNR